MRLGKPGPIRVLLVMINLVIFTVLSCAYDTYTYLPIVNRTHPGRKTDKRGDEK